MNSRTKTFIINETDEGIRLDVFLVSQLDSESFTRSFIQKRLARVW